MPRPLSADAYSQVIGNPGDKYVRGRFVLVALHDLREACVAITVAGCMLPRSLTVLDFVLFCFS